MSNDLTIRKRTRDSILQSLRAGVTPTRGLQYIQVGREAEVKALLGDIERICDGGSAFRLIIGEFGSGKTFFLHLVKNIALEKGLVVASADLNPDRRLHATSGQARSLYSELMRNLSTRTKKDGNALLSVVELFVTSARKQAQSVGTTASEVISHRLDRLNEFVGGYDFASVVEAYWRGYESGNAQLQSDAVRWLRAEFTTKTDARNALGVRTFIDDAYLYDHLKLMSLFARLAGFTGLLVNLDELVNLYKLGSTQARTSNYEQILRMLNDCLQGAAEGYGILMGGTPEFLMDPRKGLYSYPALHSRLSENTFSKSSGIRDLSGPVLHLENLKQEDLFILLKKIRDIFANYNPEAHLVPEEAIVAFLQHCNERLGAAYFKTPRSTIKAYTEFLSILEQNPKLDWRSMLPDVQLERERNTDMNDTELTSIESNEADHELTDFRL